MSISRLLSPGVSGAASTFTRARLVSSVAAALVALSGAQAMGQEEERIGGYSLQLEEVVVTAQKREENYMSVPVTVNAFTARLAWENDDGSIEVALWGKNLLDEEYAGNPGGLATDVLGAAFTSIQDPLTYGVDLRYAF